MVLKRSKKKLHWVEAGKQTDWDGLPRNKRSLLQEIAYVTGGFLTLSNLISVSGFFLVVLGLYNFATNDSVIGVAQIMIGRSLDYFDGIVADVTQTKSFIGATLDASLDTLEFILAVVLLLDLHILPVVLVVGISVPKAFNAVGYTVAKIRCKRMNTTGQSKIATAFLWLSIVLFLYEHMTIGLTTLPFSTAAWITMIIAIMLSIPASLEYLLVGFTRKQQSA